MNQVAAKTITVCADDFGLYAMVTDAIIELIAARRLSATSVLVFAPDAARGAPLLAACCDTACSIGLHFTLTEMLDVPGRVPVSAVALRAYLGALKRDTIRGVLHRQLERFEQLFGRGPAFVDGHEHIHQLPIVRDVLVESVVERYGHSVALRSTRSAVPRGAKTRLIASLGARPIERLAAENSLVTNKDFAGSYSFSDAGRYRERMRAWLATIIDRGLIMCHPGSGARADSIAAARREEYDYLRSPHWPADLTESNAILAPFPGIGLRAR